MHNVKERILLYNCRYKPAKWIAIVGVLLQAACMPSTRHEVSAAPATEATVDAYLTMLYQFGNADTYSRAALYERISTDTVLNPTAANRLQLALLKAWPGHTGHNPEAALQMLQTVLVQDYALTPEVENLARVYFLIVEQQLQTSGRNRALAAELDAAHQKLEALTNIERAVETPATRAEASP
jgi:hypothetical protein